MSMPSAYVPPFSAGAILSTGFGVMFSRFLPILFASILVHIPLLAFYVLADPWTIVEFANTQLLVLLVDLVLSFVLSGAISTLVVGALTGRDPGVGGALGVGFSRLFSILGVTILLALMIGIPAFVIGFIGAAMGQVGLILAVVLVIVIALLLMARFWVAVPVAVVERADPITALGASADMTRDRRASIIGALIVLGIINAAIGFLIEKLMNGMVQSIEDLKPAMYLSLGIGIVIGMIGPCMAAGGYYLMAAADGRFDQPDSQIAH